MTAESSEPRPDELAAIGALRDPKRRALYEFIAIAGDWVSRDRAAEAVSLERGTAAHHLERLVADGLLDVDFRRLSGRQGPGAGRPAKLYRRAEHEFDVSLPRVTTSWRASCWPRPRTAPAPTEPTSSRLSSRRHEQRANASPRRSGRGSPPPAFDDRGPAGSAWLWRHFESKASNLSA